MLSAAIRAASDNGLLFDLTLAWLTVLAVAPAGEGVAVSAEQEARSLIERTGFVALRPLLERLVDARSSAPGIGGRPVKIASSTTSA